MERVAGYSQKHSPPFQFSLQLSWEPFRRARCALQLWKRVTSSTHNLIWRQTRYITFGAFPFFHSSRSVKHGDPGQPLRTGLWLSWRACYYKFHYSSGLYSSAVQRAERRQRFKFAEGKIWLFISSINQIKFSFCNIFFVLCVKNGLCWHLRARTVFIFLPMFNSFPFYKTNNTSYVLNYPLIIVLLMNVFCPSETVLLVKVLYINTPAEDLSLFRLARIDNTCQWPSIDGGGGVCLWHCHVDSASTFVHMIWCKSMSGRKAEFYARWKLQVTTGVIALLCWQFCYTALR